MTPQAFSYPIVANNGMIYIPPFGLTESIDYMLKFNPKDETFTRIKLDVSDCTEKWIWGTAWRNKIIVLPYNEDNILIIDTDDDSVEYSEVEKGKGKYIQGHIHGDNLFALPYGEHEPYDYVLNLALPYMYPDQEKLKLPTNDCKKWHTTQIIDGIIYGLPRGESLDNSFNYRIEFDCSNEEYELTDMLPEWEDYEHDGFNNKKYTTMAKVGNRLYAPPYSENPNFDVLTKFVDGKWITERTGIKETSRTYFAHSVASNGKIFCPPAGHEETWSEMLVIDPSADNGHDTYWHTVNLGIGKESKKFFAGVENSKGYLYFMPRGGCVCEPESTWKSQGDLTEILKLDIRTEEFTTIDVSKLFKDDTSIEKYNKCVILDDVIYAFPYGQSKDFHKLLIFDTLTEKTRTMDLRDV